MEFRIIEKMVAAMEIAKNESVLMNFWGNESELDDLAAFENVFSNMGIKTISLKHTDECILQQMKDEIWNEEWYDCLDEYDIVIDIINRPPGMLPQGMSNEEISYFGAHLQKLFAKFSVKKKMIQITMPSDANAMLAGIDTALYKERVIKALDVDYVKIKVDCEEKIQSFSGTTRTLLTGDGCELIMQTEGREWIVDAGDGALPCGEVYIAPLEMQTEGTIFLECMDLEDYGCFKDVICTVEHGILVKTNSKEVNEVLEQLPESGRVVAELGIGMNPNVEYRKENSVLDENAIGTFHIAIGMNHLFGGTNVCPVHYDFVTTGAVL